MKGGWTHDYISYILHIYMKEESSAYSQEQTKKTRCQCGKSEPTDAKNTQDKGQVPFHINIDKAGRRTERAEGKPSGKEKDENNESRQYPDTHYKYKRFDQKKGIKGENNGRETVKLHVQRDKPA